MRTVLSLSLIVLLFAAFLSSSACEKAFAGSASSASNTTEKFQSDAMKADKSFSLSSLKPEEIVAGFRTDALYQDNSDAVIGGRFRHLHTGFTLDYVQIQSVPQAFMWVNTVASSDSGAAHTQEHLLLGKGNKGRNVATLGELALVRDTAMTMNWRTCYHFNTTAGADAFFQQLALRLDAMLNPDYTDTEVKREVRNFGVAEDSNTKKLKLEEKGTVYNEMVSAVRDPSYPFYDAKITALYGTGHPLTFNSGGEPEKLRELTPDQIRDFHKEHYKLGNMGMIAAFPKEMSALGVLERLNGILNELQKEPVDAIELTRGDLPDFPPPKSLADGLIQIVPYAEKNKQKPGYVDFSWAPTLKLDSREELLIGLFLSNFAGDPSTPLYKKFVDSKTNVMNVGASSVYGGVSDDPGFPISIGLGNVEPRHITRANLEKMREIIIAELRRVSVFKPGSKELSDFNIQIKGRLRQVESRCAEFVNTPPSFGTRNLSASWMEHFNWLARSNDFKRSLTLKPDVEFVKAKLTEKGNIWSGYLKKWKLLDKLPIATALLPEPKLLEKTEAEDKARLEKELARLKSQYGTKDDQVALQEYKKAYELETAKLDALAKNTKDARFTDNPPMTEDDHLDYKLSVLPGGVPICTSTFDNMTVASTKVALKFNSVPDEDLFYLALLPSLLSSVGVIENGKPLSYETVLGRWRDEISYVNVGYSCDPDTGLSELSFSGVGNNPAEAVRAVYWLNLLMQHPNWKIANLTRIRDCVEHALTGYRSIRQSGYEENWVNDPPTSYRFQKHALYLHTQSFLTKTHDVQRLRWLLKGDVNAPTKKFFVSFMAKLKLPIGKRLPKRSELTTFLERLDKKAVTAKRSGTSKAMSASKTASNSKTSASKAHAASKTSVTKLPSSLELLLKGFAALPSGSAQLVSDAAKDLLENLQDIPDSSIQMDWNKICDEIVRDIQVSPATTLSKLDSLRKHLLKKSAARVVVVGSTAAQKKLTPAILGVLDGLDKGKFQALTYSGDSLILQRLRQRDHDLAQSNKIPLFLGLINDKTTQGVFNNSAPAIKYTDLDEDSLLRFLSTQLYAGGGAHSLFNKTWSAGLAYGNGVRCDVNGRLSYYADKSPSLPETLKFVIAQINKAEPDPALVDYALSQVFYSNAASTFIGRGQSIAYSIANGEPPEVVRKFRQAILKLRSKPDLANLLFERMKPEYAKVLPGLGVKSKDVSGGIYFVVGDEKQLSQYESYLKGVEGPATKIYRLYGRDYWID